MPVYYVTPYYLKPEKAAAFRDFINSPKGKKLIKDYEKETGTKYIGTFFTVLGFGDYDAEDWWEMKDYAAFDKIRASKTQYALADEVIPFVDVTKYAPSRLYRSASDVLIYWPKKKEK
ncbi:MAG TPA: hypothetical protein VMS77_08195 [Conexivisphaerales archaeon]|nr:hypothetical protein [Conexivisphaerales archaeon]